MPRPKKGQKKEALQLIEEKKKAIIKIIEEIEAEKEQCANILNAQCEETCLKIKKLYEDKLKSLPENIRNMTLTEYLEFMEKQKKPQSPDDIPSTIRSEYEKSKLQSEVKRTQKKNRELQKKRSVSVSDLSFLSGKKACPSSTLSHTTRILSESSLYATPLSKRSAVPARISTCVVTPKFNPNAPINKVCLRRPRAGEVVMSLSGSPLHNVVDDLPDKPGGLAVSLGGGKVLKITDDVEMDKLDNEFLKKLDETTKSTLSNVKAKLEKFLKM